MEDSVFEKEGHHAGLGFTVNDRRNAVKRKVRIGKICAVGDLGAKKFRRLKCRSQRASREAHDPEYHGASTALDRLHHKLEIIPTRDMVFFEKVSTLGEFPQRIEMGFSERHAALAQEALTSLTSHEKAFGARSKNKNLTISLRAQAADVKRCASVA